MSYEPNTRYLEEKRQMLVTAIERGDKNQEMAIREELAGSGLLSADQIEELEETL